ILVGLQHWGDANTTVVGIQSGEEDPLFEGGEPAGRLDIRSANRNEGPFQARQVRLWRRRNAENPSRAIETYAELTPTRGLSVIRTLHGPFTVEAAPTGSAEPGASVRTPRIVIMGSSAAGKGPSELRRFEAPFALRETLIQVPEHLIKHGDEI